VSEQADRLLDLLAHFDNLAVAVSGGVDSMTLAWFAHRALGSGAAIYHSVSPAVPPEATARVRQYAQRYGWQLVIVDAHELADNEYVANSINRCYFCKRDLYQTIRGHTDWPIASGTNLDDLDDFRPGLLPRGYTTLSLNAAFARQKCVRSQLEPGCTTSLRYLPHLAWRVVSKPAWP
jgi:uncharacterized protein